MQHDFILLDRSGSMSSMWTEAVNSVNAYVKNLADTNVDTGVTLAVFDSNHNGGLDFTVLRDRIIPKTWRAVDPKEVEPRGMTPLNDATGRIVSLAKAGPALDQQYDRVAIIIMTDGHENASRELSVDQAKKLLDECRTKGWQVIFLGANFDNAAQAMAYGAGIGHTIQTSAVNLGATMRATSLKRAAYGVAGTAMNYTAEEKDALKEDKPVDAE